MRKILLITEIFPPVHGGSGRWFWEIYRRFPSGSVEVCTDLSEDGGDVDNSFPHSVHRVPMSSKAWGIASFQGVSFYYGLWKKVERIVRRQSIEQIHCGRIIPEGLPALVNKWRRGIPYSCYVHGEDIEVARTSREITFLTRLVMRNAERLIANSENTAQILRTRWNIEDQLFVMTPGVDVDAFFPLTPCQRSLWSNKKVVLTVGRLQKRKGQDMMIRALPAIREKIPEIHYCIVGGGSEEKPLRKLAHSLGVEENVEFAGELSDQKMLEYYQQCDLFALPNRRVNNDDEGFGMVLLEAESCGRPVLAGDSGGTRETMIPNETGVIVDCTSPDPLVKKVVDLLGDVNLRENMGRAGRLLAEQKFSWEKLAQKAIEQLA